MNIIEKFKSMFSSFYFEATAKLADGKDIRIDGDIAVGAKVYLITTDGEIAMADGEWPLDNSKIIIVKDGEIIDVKEEAEENTEEPVTETEVVVGTEMAEVTETEVVAEVETTNKEELGSEVVDTIKLINDLETKLQELYAKFDALMTSVNEMSDKVDKKTTEYDAKFSRVKTVEPLTKNEFEEPTKKFDSPYLGSYEDYKNRKK